jgi:hypothetical protein
MTDRPFGFSTEAGDILRADEQNANPSIVDAPGISVGRQSRVQVLEFKFANNTEQILWKNMGVGKGLTEDEAQRLHTQLRTYRRSLRNHGWNVPKLFHTHLARVGDEWLIMSYEQFIPGGDSDHTVADPGIPNYRKWFLLRTIIETLGEYPPDSLSRKSVSGRKLTMLPHGLDLKLANLVESEDQVWFVDLFGPKEMVNGAWVFYSPKLDSLDKDRLMAVCATREGAILRLFRLAEPSWTGSGSIGLTALRDNFEDILEQSGLPEEEITFIMSEVQGGFPWLDQLYEERAI